MRRRRRSRAVLAAVVLVVAAAVAFAAGLRTAVAPVRCDRYAAPGGDDGAAGTRAHPFRTPQRLAEALRPGQQGCLRGGTYRAGRDLYVLAIRDGRRISVRSARGEDAVLVGIVMVAHRVAGARLSHLRVEGTGAENTIKIYGRDVVVEHSDITNRLRGRSCMILGSSVGGRATRPVIRDNEFHDCGAPGNGNKDHGIYVAEADDGRITGNAFTNSAAYAIQLYPDAQGTVVRDNRIRGGPDTVRGGIVIGGDSRTASSGNHVEDNVITDTATEGVETFWEGDVGRGNVVRDNCSSPAALVCRLR